MIVHIVQTRLEHGCQRAECQTATMRWTARLALLRFPGPSVLQRDGPVEHQLAGRAILIEREVGQALKLIAEIGLRVLEAWLALGGHDLQ